MEILNVQKTKKEFIVTNENLEEVFIKKEWVQLLKSVRLSFSEKILLLSAIETERQNNKGKRALSESKIYNMDFAGNITFCLNVMSFERLMAEIDNQPIRTIILIISDPASYAYADSDYYYEDEAED